MKEEVVKPMTGGITAYDSRENRMEAEAFSPVGEEYVSQTPAECVRPRTRSAVPNSFAAEQIGNLVHQVFVPGWPKPARQVVFSPVDETTDITEICAQVGQVIATEESRTVCVVEVNAGRSQTADKFSSITPPGLYESESPFSMRGNLWRTPLEVLLGESETRIPSGLLRDRLAELREKFDYTLLQGPAAGRHSEAALLGRLCDGVILVLEANSTRRMAALKAKEKLVAANARLLGTILTERTFPIPEALYRKL